MDVNFVPLCIPFDIIYVSIFSTNYLWFHSTRDAWLYLITSVMKLDFKWDWKVMQFGMTQDRLFWEFGKDWQKEVWVFGITMLNQPQSQEYMITNLKLQVFPPLVLIIFLPTLSSPHLLLDQLDLLSGLLYHFKS